MHKQTFFCFQRILGYRGCFYNSFTFEPRNCAFVIATILPCDKFNQPAADVCLKIVPRSFGDIDFQRATTAIPPLIAVLMLFQRFAQEP